MTTEDVRRGGLEVWAPSKVPPIRPPELPDLTAEQALAVAFRHLAGIGFAENMAGHITWQLDGRTDMLVNPWGLWWQELTAPDLCVVDEDARVVIHNHPHCDSTWPHTQRTVHEQLKGLPDPIIRKVTWENASRLYQHPVPVAIQDDPNAF
jgi:hypothetical protein